MITIQVVDTQVGCDLHGERRSIMVELTLGVHATLAHLAGGGHDVTQLTDMLADAIKLVEGGRKE
ncbi:MAG: hypothetical protein RSE23_01715 [Clostridia bacterium]